MRMRAVAAANLGEEVAMLREREVAPLRDLIVKPCGKMPCRAKSSRWHARSRYPTQTVQFALSSFQPDWRLFAPRSLTNENARPHRARHVMHIDVAVSGGGGRPVAREFSVASSNHGFSQASAGIEVISTRCNYCARLALIVQGTSLSMMSFDLPLQHFPLPGRQRAL